MPPWTAARRAAGPRAPAQVVLALDAPAAVHAAQQQLDHPPHVPFRQPSQMRLAPQHQPHLPRLGWPPRRCAATGPSPPCPRSGLSAASAFTSHDCPGGQPHNSASASAVNTPPVSGVGCLSSAVVVAPPRPGRWCFKERIAKPSGSRSRFSLHYGPSSGRFSRVGGRQHRAWALRYRFAGTDEERLVPQAPQAAIRSASSGAAGP